MTSASIAMSDSIAREAASAFVYKRFFSNQYHFTHARFGPRGLLYLLNTSNRLFVYDWREAKFEENFELRSTPTDFKALFIYPLSASEVIIADLRQLWLADLKSQTDSVLFVHSQFFTCLDVFNDTAAMWSQGNRTLTLFNLTAKAVDFEIQHPSFEVRSLAGSAALNVLYMTSQKEVVALDLTTRALKYVLLAQADETFLAAKFSSSMPEFLLVFLPSKVVVIDGRTNTLWRSVELTEAISQSLAFFEILDVDRLFYAKRTFNGVTFQITDFNLQEVSSARTSVPASINGDNETIFSFDAKNGNFVCGVPTALKFGRLVRAEFELTEIGRSALCERQTFRKAVQINGKVFLVFANDNSNIVQLEDIEGVDRRTIVLPTPISLIYVDEKEVVGYVNKSSVILFTYNWDAQQWHAKTVGAFSLQKLREDLLQHRSVEELIDYLSWTVTGHRLLVTMKTIHFLRRRLQPKGKLQVRWTRLPEAFQEGRLLILQNFRKHLSAFSIGHLNCKKLVHKYRFEPYRLHVDRIDKFPEVSARKVNFFAYNIMPAPSIVQSTLLGAVSQLKELAPTKRANWDRVDQLLVTEVVFEGKLVPYSFSNNITKFVFFRTHDGKNYSLNKSDDDVLVSLWFTITSHFQPMYSYYDAHGFYWVFATKKNDPDSLIVFRV